MALVAMALALVAMTTGVVALHGVRTATRIASVALTPADPPYLDDVEWELQWIEPGVFVLANTSPRTAAFQVEVSSSLTPVSGGAATAAVVLEQRVNPGSWVEVRHPGVAPEMFEDLQQLRRSSALTDELRLRPSPLTTADQATLAAADEQVYRLQDRVEYTLAYSVSWRTMGGAVRHQTPLDQRLVPSPAGF